MGYFAQTYNYDFPSSSASGSGSENLGWLVGFVVGVVIAAILLYSLPQLIINWKLFKKAGYKGWESIIPVYSTWVESKIAKAPEWLFIAIVIISYGFSSIPYVNIFFILPSLALNVYLLVLFSKQYDRDVSFWVLYFLLPIVAVFMVGKAKYIGDIQHQQTQKHPATAVSDATITASQPLNQNSER